jgi:hypothetical protein
MPLSKYFGGSGEKVMARMQAEYGPEKGKRVFYATAHARGQVPARKKKTFRLPSKGQS